VVHETFFNNLKNHTLNLVKKACNQDVPKIVLGLSGGPDSLFLLYLLSELKKENKLDVIAAHLDHGWRQNSYIDVEFCQNYCEKLGVKFVSEHAANLDFKVKFNGSMEEVGRKLRRIFFQTIFEKEKANLIALAHHQQDQQETFFMRIIRGTTMQGLRCMDEFDGKYIRPLIKTNKQDIINFLQANDIQFLQDPTNTSDTYLRNRIRKYVLPALERCDERFDKKFQTTLEAIKTENDFLHELATKCFLDVFQKNQQQLLMGNLKKFRDLHAVLQSRIIVIWLVEEQVIFQVSSALIKEILKFLNHPSGRTHQINSTTQICKKQSSFWIEKTKKPGLI